jgi:hypothetical protein
MALVLLRRVLSSPSTVKPSLLTFSNFQARTYRKILMIPRSHIPATVSPWPLRPEPGGVPRTLTALEEYGIPRRIVKAGDLLAAVEVQIDVLHPPAEGPDGNENVRSLVLRVRHAGHTLLLTGDIEGPGLERVLGLSPEHVDVLISLYYQNGVRKKQERPVAPVALGPAVLTFNGVAR